eukprot:5495076-Amphidinium_carterae.1
MRICMQPGSEGRDRLCQPTSTPLEVKQQHPSTVPTRALGVYLSRVAEQNSTNTICKRVLRLVQAQS